MDAFWRMVWENKCDLIVMLTGLREEGKWKCVMYWPDPREGPGFSQTYEPSGIKITILSIETKGCIVLLQLKLEWNGQMRRVAHAHFTAWPDHGVPRGTDDIVTLSNFIRRHYKESPKEGPILIHCSAGVGRTGVVMGIDFVCDQVCPSFLFLLLL